MLSPKSLLVTCATLLCLENREGITTSPSNELVKEVLGSLPIPETTIDTDHSRQTFLELRNVVNWLNIQPKTNWPTETEILQKIQMAAREEVYLYEAILNALMTPGDVKQLTKLILGYRGTLSTHVNEERILGIMKETSNALLFKRHMISDVKDVILEMGERLKPFVESRSKSAHPALRSSMSTDDADGLAKHFEDVKIMTSSEGGMRTGWQAMNRFLGPNEVMKRGEFVLMSALQHNFKTGTMLSLYTHFALFNKPFLRDPTKIPLLYFVTLENEVPDNVLWLYRYMKENETGVAVIDSEVNPQEAAAYVIGKLSENGFKVIMDRFDPTEFNAAGFLARLDQLQAEGYEIIALLVDYLNMVSKTGIDFKVAGDDIRYLFRRIRNYTSPRGILTLTPHQMSSDAVSLLRENIEDFVKTVANKNYYDGCKRLGQEPDLEFFQHIVKTGGKSYLTLQRGKHRNVVCAEKNMYFVLPFQEIGTIPWDIDKEDSSVAFPGGGGQADGEAPWWG